MEKAVFIDKDGTLVKNIPFNVDPELVELEEKAGIALARIYAARYKLILVSNQPGVALDYFDEDDLLPVFEKIQALLAPYDLQVDGFYYCPHYMFGKRKPYNVACRCRKPAAGMLIRAAEDFDIDLSASWMIGDILDDVEAGNTAGCSTILIDNGNETEWIFSKKRSPRHVVADLKQAADIICTPYKSCYE